MRRKLSLQRPKRFKIKTLGKKNGPMYYYYSLEEHLHRIFGNINHCNHMTFQTPSSGKEKMSEFPDTPMWRDMYKSTDKNKLPVGIIIYYDKFGVYRSKNGSLGGLYFFLVNFDSGWRYNEENIFCLGLIPKEGNFHTAISMVIQELNELERKGLNVYHRGFKRCLQIEPSFQLFLADMPQRNEACSQKSHTAICPCRVCTVRDSELADPFNAETMKIRSQEISRDLVEAWKNMDPGEQTRWERVTGINGQTNPFWSTANGFDVHKKSPPEILHLEIIGLLKKHFGLVWEKGLTENASKRQTIKVMNARFDRFDTEGMFQKSTRPDCYKTWLGDDWMTWLQISPWILRDLLKEEDYK